MMTPEMTTKTSRPADTDMMEWAWDGVRACWSPQPTTKARKAEKVSVARRILAEVEALQQRAVREMLLAMAVGGLTNCTAALAALQTADDRCAALRSKIADINAATSHDELNLVIVA